MVWHGTLRLCEFSKHQYLYLIRMYQTRPEIDKVDNLWNSNQKQEYSIKTKQKSDLSKKSFLVNKKKPNQHPKKKQQLPSFQVSIKPKRKIKTHKLHNAS